MRRIKLSLLDMTNRFKIIEGGIWYSKVYTSKKNDDGRVEINTKYGKRKIMTVPEDKKVYIEIDTVIRQSL